MSHYRIAVLPGDGIGPEVMDATLKVLDAALSCNTDFQLAFTTHSVGAEHYRQTGEVLPDAVLADCKDADAVFLAAIGLPDVRLSDGTEVQPKIMVGLRRAMGLYAAVRPIKLYPGVPSPLRDTESGIDFVVVRENLEGLFASYGNGSLSNDEVATDKIQITRTGTERVVEHAFRLAERRGERLVDGRQSVTCVDKANVFRSFAFFRKVFFEVAECHPDISATAEYVDATSMQLIQNPEAYNVLVMENQFGDILSEIGAGLIGGLGLAPSAEIGDNYAMFQPSHGSAPLLAGRDIANPLAAILSAVMMLDWLGERYSDQNAVAAARNIENAVVQVLALGAVLPKDLGGNASTSEVGQAVADEISSKSEVVSR